MFPVPIQTGEFLGRKLAKRLKSMSQEGTEADVASARARKEAEEGGDNNEVLRHERRKVEDRLDLEVLDDRDLYQHLLKVCMMGGDELPAQNVSRTSCCCSCCPLVGIQVVPWLKGCVSSESC